MKSTDKSEMKERFIAIRKKLDLNQKEFAEKVGCHRNRISDVERGLREPPKRTIYALCTELHIDLNWFVTGEGSMFQNETTKQADRASKEYEKQVELQEKLLVEKSKRLDEKDEHIKLLKQMLGM